MMSDQGLIWGAGFNDPCLFTKRVLAPALREMHSILRASTIVVTAIVCRAIRPFRNVSLVSVLAGTSRPRGAPQTNGS
jgi:hypothetical protein